MRDFDAAFRKNCSKNKGLQLVTAILAVEGGTTRAYIIYLNNYSNLFFKICIPQKIPHNPESVAFYMLSPTQDIKIIQLYNGRSFVRAHSQKSISALPADSVPSTGVGSVPNLPQV